MSRLGALKDDQVPRLKGRAAGRDLAPTASAAPESPSIFETAITSMWPPESPGTTRPAPRSSTIDCRRRSRPPRSSASTSEWCGDGHRHGHFARSQSPTRERMNKSELSSRVASDASLSRVTAASVVDAVLSTIADTLAQARVSRSPDSGCSPQQRARPDKEAIAGRRGHLDRRLCVADVQGRKGPSRRGQELTLRGGPGGDRVLLWGAGGDGSTKMGAERTRQRRERHGRDWEVRHPPDTIGDRRARRREREAPPCNAV